MTTAKMPGAAARAYEAYGPVYTTRAQVLEFGVDHMGMEAHEYKEHAADVMHWCSAILRAIRAYEESETVGVIGTRAEALEAVEFLTQIACIVSEAGDASEKADQARERAGIDALLRQRGVSPLSPGPNGH